MPIIYSKVENKLDTGDYIILKPKAFSSKKNLVLNKKYIKVRQFQISAIHGHDSFRAEIPSWLLKLIMKSHNLDDYKITIKL